MVVKVLITTVIFIIIFIVIIIVIVVVIVMIRANTGVAWLPSWMQQGFLTLSAGGGRGLERKD